MNAIRTRHLALTATAAAVLAAFAAPAPLPAAETAGVDFEIVDAIGWRGEWADRMPAKVTETYSYDAEADTLTIAFRFASARCAPVPPMLALAAGQKPSWLTLDAGATATAHATPIGPLVLYEGKDAFRCRITGLGKYVAHRPGPPKAGPPPAELLAELAAEVDRILSAKRPLRPWLVLVNVPGSGADNRGDVYWHNPADTLYLLAEALPVLAAADQARLRQYLGEFRTACPPEQLRSMRFDQGAAREHCPPDDALLKRWETNVLPFRLAGPPPIWSLYGLARYYEAVGDKPTADVMARCNAVVAEGLKHLDWATLYWRRGQTPGFNAVHAVNRLFAGFVGYIRLARLAGDAKAEALGWGMLGRMAALRFALGRYTQFQHAGHMFSTAYRLKDAEPIAVQTDPNVWRIPSDPAWWVKADGRSWIGNLMTWSWRGPADDIRQVHRLDETGADAWEWCGVDCGGTGQKRDPGPKDYWYLRLAPYYLPFADLTPELGLFLRDHLRPECATYLARVEQNQPHWHIAYAEAILSAENGFMTPRNAHDLFLAKAWVLGEKPDALTKLLDAAWLPRGDLFYIHKLALAAGRG